MTKFAEWLLGLIKALFKAVWDFLVDIAIGLLELILQAVVGLIGIIPVPSFMQGGGLQGLFTNLPPDVMYFVGHFKLGECLAILGAAVLFRLTRKALTLFQW